MNLLLRVYQIAELSTERIALYTDFEYDERYAGSLNNKINLWDYREFSVRCNEITMRSGYSRYKNR